MLIQNRQFSGEVPKQSDRLKGNNIAVIAKDCALSSGELKAIREPLQIRSGIAQDATVLHERDGNFVALTGDADIVDAPGESALAYVFYTGSGFPKYSRFSDLYNGDITTIKMGAPAPTSNPVNIVSIVASDRTVADQTVDSFFICTYTKNEGAVEGPPCVPLEFTHNFGDIVTIDLNTIIDVDLRALYGITGINVYRSVDDDAQLELISTYPRAGSASIPITTHGSPVLGDTIDSLENYPPPDNLSGIHIMSNGIGMGFVPGTTQVLLTKSYKLHAWAYEFTVTNPIVGISSYENTAVILTEGYPEIANVIDPQIVVPIKLNDREPCVAKRGIVQGSYGVFYPSPSGLIYISANGLSRVTQNYFGKSDWQALQPETFVAAFKDGSYYAFHGDAQTGETFVFDTDESNATVRRLSTWGTAMTTGAGTNDLFYVSGTNVLQLGGSPTKRKYLWRSSLYGGGSPFAITTRRVLSPGFRFDETTSVTLRVYAHFDGADTLVHEEDITNDKVDRIDYFDRARFWYYELEGDIDITQVDLAGSASEMHTGS